MSERWGDSQRDRDALDRHITGNYGEDQFRDFEDDSLHEVDGRRSIRDRMRELATRPSRGVELAILIGLLAILALAALIGQAHASTPRTQVASAMFAAAQNDPAVAASLIETATQNGQVVQPVGSPDPAAPADGTRRCYNSSWTRSWLEVAGAKIGQVEEDQKGFCARSKQRIVTDYGWHGNSWAWGPWCITNYDSFHGWKDIPFSKQGTATGSVGVQYPWGCGGVRTIHATHIITASGRTYGKY